MAEKKEKLKRKKEVVKEERERTFLEKLGFVQLMFDFYTSPVI